MIERVESTAKITQSSKSPQQFISYSNVAALSLDRVSTRFLVEFEFELPEVDFMREVEKWVKIHKFHLKNHWESSHLAMNSKLDAAAI
jgi:hypothetical protein